MINQKQHSYIPRLKDTVSLIPSLTWTKPYKKMITDIFHTLSWLLWSVAACFTSRRVGESEDRPPGAEVRSQAGGVGRNQRLDIDKIV